MNKEGAKGAWEREREKRIQAIDSKRARGARTFLFHREAAPFNHWIRKIVMCECGCFMLLCWTTGRCSHDDDATTKPENDIAYPYTLHSPGRAYQHVHQIIK